MAAFNRGSASNVAALFLPNAELTDDAGNVHKGRKEIETILMAFFEKFPGAQMQQKITFSRLIASSLAIQDGEQTIVTKDGKERSDNEVTAVLLRLETGWAYATLQQRPKDEEPSLHDRLEPLSSPVGDWVDEDPDGNTVISCRWSDDKNFLMVNYESNIAGKAGLKSTQRIGWDPLTERVRSWVFDSDGGYGEGQWTRVDRAWIIKSTAVMPDGDTGSATIVIEPAGPDKFTLKGLDRILGDGTQPDFQVTIVRKPPQPASDNPQSLSRRYETMKRNTFRVVAGLILVSVAWLGWNADLLGRGGGGRGGSGGGARGGGGGARTGGGGGCSGGGGGARPSMGGHAGGGAGPSGGGSRRRVSARLATCRPRRAPRFLTRPAGRRRVLLRGTAALDGPLGRAWRQQHRQPPRLRDAAVVAGRSRATRCGRAVSRHATLGARHRCVASRHRQVAGRSRATRCGRAVSRHATLGARHRCVASRHRQVAGRSRATRCGRAVSRHATLGARHRHIASRHRQVDRAQPRDPPVRGTEGRVRTDGPPAPGRAAAPGDLAMPGRDAPVPGTEGCVPTDGPPAPGARRLRPAAWRCRDAMHGAGHRGSCAD